MIRPWYRSRLFWLGIPGLVFLLWGWWDSGNAISHLEIEGPSLEKGVLHIDQGFIGFQVRRGEDPARSWDYSGWRDHITVDGFSIDFSPPGEPRKRQFDFPPGFHWEKERDEALGENPAADGWVPSPGAKLPTPELKSVKVEIAFWLVVLLYLALWGSVIGLWQRRKARLQKASAAPPP